jgi:hypothetical protein
MKQLRRVYVTQMDITWSMTPQAWRTAVEAAVLGKEFEWDDVGRRLSRKLSVWEKQYTPLDWDLEDWKDELETLREQS